MSNRLNFLNKIKRYPLWPLVWRHRRLYARGLITLVLVDVIFVLLPLMVRKALDATAQKDMQGVLWAAGAILVLMGLQAIGRYLWRVYLMGASTHIASEIRDELYAHLQRLPWPYYQRVKTGDLMSRVTADVESVRMAVGPGVLVAADALIVFVLIVPVMWVLSVKLTVLAFAFYPLAPWLTRFIGKKIELLFADLQNKLSALSSYAQESFGAIRLIKSLTLEPVSGEKFRAFSSQYAATGERLARVEASFSPALGLMTSLGTFLILIVGGKDVIEGTITLGTFVAFQRFVTQLAWPMEAIGWAVTLNREGLAAQARLDSIFAVSPVQDVAGGETPELAANLEIRKLRFSYGGAFELCLENLAVPVGAKIGIVGPVGAGKTTLFNCLLRLLDPESGSIFLGGQDIATLSRGLLKSKIASVEQQVFLFSESIASNIGMGIPAPKHDEIVHAMAVAKIMGEVEALDQKTNSVLGERGVNLSGGQKSRLALARAIVRKPAILILDDCFSAVDVEVEKKIIDSLLKEYPALTLLVASHRLSIMPRLDEIWLLDNGALADMGPHAKLYERNGLYRSLWHRSQLETVWEPAERGL